MVAVRLGDPGDVFSLDQLHESLQGIRSEQISLLQSRIFAT
ncbi:MAG: hypothetical protein ACYC1D_06445 [Acidimicrobiales bacterium]